MKLLVIGIDGGTKRIIDNMPMPFTQELFSRSKSRVLEEDLISRGWAEILTGQHASDNKGFYLMPCDDLKYIFSMSYSQAEMLASSSNQILWERINETGNSVGIMNIPTTGPAKETSGFFVAGGGGGVNVNQGFTSSHVFPAAYQEILKKSNYIVDLRLPSGAKTVTEFITKITNAEKVQKDTFIELCSMEDPEFGFQCFRMTTEIQYLARYDIEKCLNEYNKDNKLNDELGSYTAVQAAILNYYRHLDSCIRDLFMTLKPESYLFLADHSTALFEYDANIDVWLEKEGYLTKMNSYESRLNKLIFKISKRKRKLAASLGITHKLPAYRRPVTKFHSKKTMAFGTFYDTGNFAGIFINDKERFGGPVETEYEIERLTDEICSHMNGTDFSKKYDLHARPYKRLYNRAKYQRLMPDIKIEKPDTIYFSGRKPSLIEKNPNLVPLIDDLIGIRYPHTGVKGSDPLFVHSPDLEQYIEDSDPNDLRLAYRMICRYFKA